MTSFRRSLHIHSPQPKGEGQAIHRSTASPPEGRPLSAKSSYEKSSSYLPDRLEPFLPTSRNGLSPPPYAIGSTVLYPLSLLLLLLLGGLCSSITTVLSVPPSPLFPQQEVAVPASPPLSRYASYSSLHSMLSCFSSAHARPHWRPSRR